MLVEDDEATRTFVTDNLAADGYAVLAADWARDGWRLPSSQAPAPVPALDRLVAETLGVNVPASP